MGKRLITHILSLIFAVCIGGVGYFGWQIYEKQKEYQAGQESLQEVYRLMEEADPIRADLQLSKEEEDRRKLAQYKALHEKNQDMIGWISIEGTRIDYPVMYTPEDPNAYLYQNFQKEYSSYGSIYLEGSCKLDGSTKNLLLYGHHMKNGAMFASLQNYDSKEYWKEHPVLEFHTLDKIGEYEIIAAFKLPAETADEDFMRMLQAGSEEEYQKFLTFVKQHQFYRTGLNAEWPQQLVTLATCEYTQKNGRFFVVAVSSDL